MQDDGSYNLLVSQANQLWQHNKAVLPTSHKRSYTVQHNVSVPTYTKNAVQQPDRAQIEARPPSGAARPIARAKSFGDFYDIVRTQMRDENSEERKQKRKADHANGEIQFNRWYQGIRRDLSRSSHTRYHLYREQLSQTQTRLDSLLSDATRTVADLTTLSVEFKAVDEQTIEFQAECETILAAQQKTGRLAEEVAENLQYYDYLDPTTRRLNAPGAGSLVRRSEFPEILSNLDACLEYMLANPGQKEASVYGSKYRLLLTRGLTLVSNQFTSSLREISADVTKRVAERQLNDTAMAALLYAKFKSGAQELRHLCREIEIRVKPVTGDNHDAEGEYQGLLNEIHQNYTTSRRKLLQPLIIRKLTESATASGSSKDLVAFSHSATNFMRGLCSDEFTLWAEWFNDDHMLYPYLESLCDSLYDHLRPRIIRETKINKLCDTCNLIQVRYGDESGTESEDDSDERKLDFGRLIQPALQDAQDRLVFLAQGVVRTDIQYFKPKPEHLDYPRKASRVALSGRRGPAVLSGNKSPNGDGIPSNPLIIDEDGVEREFGIEPGLREFYPTLRKAVWLLSRLYGIVQSTVFDSLAHEVVHQTTISLNAAAVQISTRVSPTDANLFLLSHLLALKHHILAFDIETTDADVRVDFSTSLWDLRDGVFNPSKWYQAIGGGGIVPQVVTDMKDARTELDTRLRTVIGELVGAWASRMAAPIVAHSSSQAAGVNININGEEKRGRTDERRKSSTTLNRDAEASAKLRLTIEREVPLVRKKLEEYLHDQRTRDMLLRAVLEDLLVRYAAWLEARGGGGLDALVVSRSAAAAVAGRRSSRAKGKGREDGVWEEQAFADWAAGAFGLDSAEIMEAGDDDDDTN